MVVLRVEYEAYREKGGGEAQVKQDLQGVPSKFHAVYQNLERQTGFRFRFRFRLPESQKLITTQHFFAGNI